MCALKIQDPIKAKEPKLWYSPPAAAMEVYIQDTQAKLEIPLAGPPGGPERYYYEPQVMEGMSLRGVTSIGIVCFTVTPP